MLLLQPHPHSVEILSFDERFSVTFEWETEGPNWVDSSVKSLKRVFVEEFHSVLSDFDDRFEIIEIDSTQTIRFNGRVFLNENDFTFTFKVYEGSILWNEGKAWLKSDRARMILFVLVCGWSFFANYSSAIEGLSLFKKHALLAYDYGVTRATARSDVKAQKNEREVRFPYERFFYDSLFESVDNDDIRMEIIATFGTDSPNFHRPD